MAAERGESEIEEESTVQTGSYSGKEENNTSTTK